MGSVVALAGGVGGAKLCEGLANIVRGEQLSIVVNTGDDFTHLGLRICPDLDSVMYALAGINDQLRGWGRAAESWNFMEALKELQGKAWFQLGDKDLAMHLFRTERLKAGISLSEVTSNIAQALGVRAKVFPMTDDDCPTKVCTPDGVLEFQEYFVRLACEPRVIDFKFPNVPAAPLASWMNILGGDETEAVIICPSNPHLSVQPILRLQGVHEALKSCKAPVIAVSPIIGGKAVKGPAAKIMRELNMDVSVLGIARFYDGLIDGLVIDNVDAGHLPRLRESGLNVHCSDILMKSAEDRERVAGECLRFSASLPRRRR